MKNLLLILVLLVTLSGAQASSRPAHVMPAHPAVHNVSYGTASWYGGRWIGRKTASGEIYRAHDLTAAHKTLPFNTRVRVTDQRNGRSTIVRINNRGPFIKGRAIDLSAAAASQLGITRRGVAKVKLEVLAKDSQPPRFETWFSPSVGV